WATPDAAMGTTSVPAAIACLIFISSSLLVVRDSCGERTGARRRTNRTGCPGWWEPLPTLRGQTEAHRNRGRLAAGVDVELAQDRRDVVRHGPVRDEQVRCDLAVAQPLGHERQDLEFARRQVGRVLSRLRPRTARESLGPAAAQTP